jgi:hypothetical protein
MRRNDANVRVNALIIQEDSAAVISSDITNDGIAEKRAVILNASINCARQNIASNACLCTRERLRGTSAFFGQPDNI